MSLFRFEPHIVCRVGITEAGCLEALLEIEAEVALEGALLPWIDPHLDANDDVLSVMRPEVRGIQELDFHSLRFRYARRYAGVAGFQQSSRAVVENSFAT